MLDHSVCRLARSLALAALSVLIASGAALAQQGTTTGSISGVVRDADGTPLADAVVRDAVVRVTNVARGTQQQVLTDQNGRYTIPFLQPGTYDVEAQLPPRPPATAQNVQVNLGEQTSVSLTLQPVEAGELQVTVGGQQIDVSQSGVVENVSEQQINTLPTAGRDFTDFINLSSLVSPQPGITTGGQFSIGGARTSGTNIQIDGADANNSFFSENRGSSRVPFTFSLESVKEFQIVTNGYDVEYGRFSGGVVNAVTKSGGNEFHGSAHLFWRDQSLTANNFNDEEPIGFEAFQFGGTFSGPIVEDKLHFFLSGDFQQWNQPTFALTPERTNIPASTIDRIQNILVDDYGFESSFVQNQFGTFTETEDQSNLFARLDWTVNPDHRVTLRVNRSDFTNQNDRLNDDGTEALTAGSTFLDDALSVVGEWNATLGDGLYNTLRVQYSDEDRPRPGNSNLPHLSISGVPTNEPGATTTIGLGGENFGITFSNRLEEQKIQITDNLTYQLGDHTLKVGTDNIFTDITNEFWLNGNGIFFMSGGVDQLEAQDGGFFLRFIPDTENPQPPIARFNVNNWSAYVQDEWQATNRLLLTLGLRYDYTDYVDPGTELENATFQQAVESFGLNSTTVPNDSDNFGPRASFTYDLTGDESSLLRGGVGIFYGPMPAVTHGNVLQTTPKPILAIGCFGPSLEGYRNWTGRPPGSGNIPTTCSDFANDPFGFTDTPEIVVWDGDAEQATTYKANLGYEQRLSENWKAGVQAIYSHTNDLFGAVNRNLDTDVTDGTGFRRPSGRPVFVSQDNFDPTGSDLADAIVNDEIRALYMQTSNGQSRIWNFKLDLQGNPTEDLRLAANYSLNLAYDNSSTECCTANALLFDTPTAGNPNFLGDPGDEETGSWGPSKNERRHVFVANAIWELPADFTVSTIYRAQSGNPYTAGVVGDLNNDGDDENDRPFLPDPDNPGASGYAFASQAALDRYRTLLNEHECLQEAVGTIISRNTCRDPWWHSVDLKIKKTFDAGIAAGHRFDVIFDMFNVLDGLGLDAGEFMFESNDLFEVEDYDPTTDTMTVRTGDFGTEIPVGFTPFQFQAQVGVQYYF